MNLEERVFIEDLVPKSPSLNLAMNMRMNELVLKGDYQSSVRIYKHTPGVILGYRESINDVSQEYCKMRCIEIVERKTGGSAVGVDPKTVLCYTEYIATGEKSPDITKWYKKLVKPIAEQLNGNGRVAAVEGAYYIRVQKDDEMIPFIGHAAAVKRQIIQLDGIVHIEKPKVEEIEQVLKLRRLYNYQGQKYLIAGDYVVPVTKGLSPEQIAAFDKKDSQIVRDERDELRKILGLHDIGLDERKFIDMLYASFQKSIGPMKKTSPEKVNYGNIAKLRNEFKGSPNGLKQGLGHCFVDLVEPEPKELK